MGKTPFTKPRKSASFYCACTIAALFREISLRAEARVENFPVNAVIENKTRTVILFETSLYKRLRVAVMVVKINGEKF